MLLRYFYDRSLAHASYMVGCQKAKEALIVDPGRDLEQYPEAAQREGMKITAVAETHIHADYVSGARELADRVGAKLYVSDEGPAEWKYEYTAQYDHHACRDGDRFGLGEIEFDVMHTPGHTPESISFVLTNRGGGADKPMGIFTGDFVFVGSIGRPDLLEEAAGMMGTADVGARQLFHSVERFRNLPDHLQVWPAHGAGSACGKGLGAIPSSTVGYEKLFNPAFQFGSEEDFVRYILSDQPEAPKYFALMKRVNKEGPAVLGDRPLPASQPVEKFVDTLAASTVIDLAPSGQFGEAHVPGTLNIPLSMLAGWAGWLVDYSKPVNLICEPSQLPEAVRVLQKIGLDDIRGYFDASNVRASGLATERYESATPKELAAGIEAGEVTLVDVRSEEEWNQGRIVGAEHFFLGRLSDNLDSVTRTKPIVAQCLNGGRSAIAASILQAAGHEVTNMTGGYGAWVAAGLPVVRAESTAGREAGATQCSS